MRKITSVISAIALCALGGCLGERVAGTTGVGNPPQSAASFAMVAAKGSAAAAKTAAPADTAFQLSDRGGSRFILRSALANVGLVKFKLPDGIRCSPDLAQPCELDELKLAGPFLADLMAGAFNPAFPEFRAPHGTYRRIEVRLEALHPGKDAPGTALEGHSMVLSGTFGYRGRQDRSFTILLDFDETASFESGTATVRDLPLNKLLLRMDVDSWLSQADITRCLDDGSLALDAAGNLRIDKANSCEGLEKIIKDGIKSSGRLGEDP